MQKIKLHHWIILGMLVGLGIGLCLHALSSLGFVPSRYVQFIITAGKEIGDLFIQLLQMLVVPLITASLISSIASMENVKNLGKLGGMTIGFYLVSSVLAVSGGLLAFNVFRPGSGVSLESLEPHASIETIHKQEGLSATVWNQVKNMIPSNPIAAAAEGDMLSIIFFSVLLGIFININYHQQKHTKTRDTTSSSLVDVFQGFYQVMMRMTMAIIRLAPFGVFALMIYASSFGFDAFKALGMYVLCVICALTVHSFVILPLMYLFFTKKSPYSHAKAMSPALLTAFSTASSNAALPLSIQCMKRSGVSTATASFVLPLGATINMDGTALYEVIAVLFIAKLHGIDIPLAQQLLIAFSALIISIGAAGIPHAGLVMMVAILSMVGLPSSSSGLILAVDRILDMYRTCVQRLV